MTRGLAVLASGLVTAVGYNHASSLAALRAGISGVRANAWADDESGTPIRCARVSLPQRWTGVALHADLVAPAVHECVDAAGVGLSSLPLLVGIAHPGRPGRVADLDAQLLPSISERLGAPLHPASQVFAADQMGAALALIEAERLIHEGIAPRVIVAGVDSLICRQTLEAFVERRRVLTPANSNGFLPGEAGSAVLVGAASSADAVASGREALRIAGWGIGVESAPIEGTAPLRGNGLQAAIRGALQSSGTAFAEVAFRVTDLSGEHYKFKEALLALLRFDHQPRARPLELWHPVEYLGEIGAAILPCLLAWTAHALRHGYAPGRRALCHVGSDDGQRMALVLQPAGA